MKSNPQTLAAILDSPPAITGSVRERLIRLAALSQRQLAAIVRSDDPESSREALFVLSTLNNRGASIHLLNIVLDQSLRPYTRRSACSDLDRCGSKQTWRRILGLLNSETDDLDAYGKVLLLQAIEQQVSIRVIQIFSRFLRDKQEAPMVRAQAAVSLSDSFDDGLPSEVEYMLIEQLIDESPEVRCACCTALSRSKNETVVAALEDLIEDKTIVSLGGHFKPHQEMELGECARAAISKIRSTARNDAARAKIRRQLTASAA